MTLDIKDFYLMTPLPRSEYIRIPQKFLSAQILAKHSLHPFLFNKSVLFEVTKSMYGLPHAGKIAQDSLVARLAPATTHGYLQTGTTCLFCHVTNGVAFTLVVDDFGVKFKDSVGADDLIRCLQLYYTLTIKKDATKYLGLTIAVDNIARESPYVCPECHRQGTATFRSPWLDLLPSTSRLASVLQRIPLTAPTLLLS